MGDSEVK